MDLLENLCSKAGICLSSSSICSNSYSKELRQEKKKKNNTPKCNDVSACFINVGGRSLAICQKNLFV